MFDELDRLRANPHLVQLLSHYGKLGEANREAWQSRLMGMEGIEPSELTKLHGLLLAFAWVEQNTGHVPVCYRVTLAGQRALRQIVDAEEHEKLEAVALAAE